METLSRNCRTVTRIRMNRNLPQFCQQATPREGGTSNFQFFCLMTCEFSLQRTAWTVKKHYPTGISALITLEARGAKTCSNCADVVQRLSQFTYSLLKPSISSCPEGQSLINPEYHCFISILLTSGRRMVVCMWQVGADERARHGDLRRGVIQVFYRWDNLDFCVHECVYACVCVCWGGLVV